MRHVIFCFVAILLLGLDTRAQVRTTWHQGGTQKASEGRLTGADPAIFTPGFDQLPKDVQAAKLAAAKKDGKWTYWFEDGKVSAEEEYVQGKMTGTWKSFQPSGAKVFEIDFVSGKAVYYHPDGGIESEGLMLSGMMQQGAWKGYYPNGNLNYTGSFLNGKKDGVWIFYDESGKKFIEQVFKAGSMQSSRKL